MMLSWCCFAWWAQTGVIAHSERWWASEMSWFLTAKKCTRKCWFLACISMILGLMSGASRIVRRDISLSHMHHLKQTVPQKCTACANGKNSEGGRSLTIPCIPALWSFQSCCWNQLWKLTTWYSSVQFKASLTNSYSPVRICRILKFHGISIHFSSLKIRRRSSGGAITRSFQTIAAKVAVWFSQSSSSLNPSDARAHTHTREALEACAFISSITKLLYAISVSISSVTSATDKLQSSPVATQQLLLQAIYTLEIRNKQINNQELR